MFYKLSMHLQLPGAVLDQIEAGASEIRPDAPETNGVLLDRVVLNRHGRKVKFYFRKNRHKRCYSDLSVEQVKALSSALLQTGKRKSENFVFDDDVYLVSPSTKCFVR